MNSSTSCWGSSTCKYFTFPVSPKFCLYSSPSSMMIRSSWAKYFAALGSTFRSSVSYGSFNIFSLRFLVRVVLEYCSRSGCQGTIVGSFGGCICGSYEFAIFAASREMVVHGAHCVPRDRTCLGVQML